MMPRPKKSPPPPQDLIDALQDRIVPASGKLIKSKPIKTPKKAPDTMESKLAKIADRMKAGVDPEAFQKELDALLGTEFEERDAVAEESWELAYRNQGSDE